MSAISRIAYFAAVKHPMALAVTGAATAAVGFGLASALGPREGTGRSIAIDSLGLVGAAGAFTAGIGAMHLEPFMRLGIHHPRSFPYLLGGVAAGSGAAYIGHQIGRALSG